MPGQPCPCSEGRTWLPFYTARCQTAHSQGWGSGSPPPARPGTVGTVLAVPRPDLSELLSFLLGSVTTNAVFSWFPTINCDARLLLVREGHGAVSPGCAKACPEVGTGPGAVGPGCPLGHSQQVPTVPSPGSADVSGPTRALPTWPLPPCPGLSGGSWTLSKLLQRSWRVPRVPRHLLRVGIGAGPPPGDSAGQVGGHRWGRALPG